MALAPTGDPNFVIQVNSEKMLVTAIAGNILTVKRGYDGTDRDHSRVRDQRPQHLAPGPRRDGHDDHGGQRRPPRRWRAPRLRHPDRPGADAGDEGLRQHAHRRSAGYDYTTASVHCARAPVSVQPTLAAAVTSAHGDDRDRHRRGRLRPRQWL